MRELPNTLREHKIRVKRNEAETTHPTSKTRSSITTHRAGSSSIALTHAARRCSAV